ncbi:MAG: hypothetical protein C5B60_10555 [Chloroflexi bacterium]|nr:MAG: hypothetical protein C5B60_10555 [Chloroflexota bacterium]
MVAVAPGYANARVQPAGAGDGDDPQMNGLPRAQVIWGIELATGFYPVVPYAPPAAHARWGERWEYPGHSPRWWDGTPWALPEEAEPPPHVTMSDPPFGMRATGVHHRGLYVS